MTKVEALTGIAQTVLRFRGFGVVPIAERNVVLNTVEACNRDFAIGADGWEEHDAYIELLRRMSIGPEATEKRGYHKLSHGSFEVFWVDGHNEKIGWYWWPCSPGRAPDNDANGPFVTSLEAYKAAQEAQ